MRGGSADAGSGMLLEECCRGVRDAQAQMLDVVDGLVEERGNVVVVEGVAFYSKLFGAEPAKGRPG